MSELGAMLKQAREERGITLDDLQDSTKIRKHYLEAIEQGDYSLLPGSFYVRAFVKNYAETVGLDSEEVLTMYQKEIPNLAALHATADQPILKPRRASSRMSERWGKWGFTIVMLAFVVLLIIVLYWFVIKNGPREPNQINDPPFTSEQPGPDNSGAQPGGNGNQPGQGSEQEQEPEPEIDPEPEQDPEPEVKTTLTLVETTTSRDKYEVSPAGTYKLELKILENNSWIAVHKGTSAAGERLVFRDAQAPEVISLDIDSSVYISIGRADRVELYYDGQLIDDTDEGTVKKFIFELQAAESPAGTEQQ